MTAMWELSRVILDRFAVLGDSPLLRVTAKTGYLQITDYDVQLINGELYWYRYSTTPTLVYTHDKLQLDDLCQKFHFYYSDDYLQHIKEIV